MLGSLTDSTGEGKEGKKPKHLLAQKLCSIQQNSTLTEYPWQLLQSASQKSLTCVKLLAIGLRQLTLHKSLLRRFSPPSRLMHYLHLIQVY